MQGAQGPQGPIGPAGPAGPASILQRFYDRLNVDTEIEEGPGGVVLATISVPASVPPSGVWELLGTYSFSLNPLDIVGEGEVVFQLRAASILGPLIEARHTLQNVDGQALRQSGGGAIVFGSGMLPEGYPPLTGPDTFELFAFAATTALGLTIDVRPSNSQHAALYVQEMV